VVFVEAPRDEGEIERIAREVPGPLLINVVWGGLTPELPARRLVELGYRIAIHPGAALEAATEAVLRALAGMLGIDPGPMLPSSPRALFELVGLRQWEHLGERYR
jgi:2-methylisocitrate lyase-like PEP mutase family enzyme